MPEKSMTPDPREILQRGVEAGSRRDIDGALAAIAPDGVWDMSSVGMGTFKGHEQIRPFLEDWMGAYEEYAMALEELQCLGNDVTFAVYLQQGRPAGSTSLVEFRYAAVSTWASGLITWQTHYTDIDTARSAAERLVEELGQSGA